MIETLKPVLGERVAVIPVRSIARTAAPDLLGSLAQAGAASRNRTDDTCLEGRGFTIKL
jgi:hypothetical protein